MDESFEAVGPDNWTVVSDAGSSATSTTPVPPTGLSQGAAIGIEVGAALGAVALLGVLAWALWWRRKGIRRRDQDQATSGPEQGTEAEKAGLAGLSANQSSRDLASELQPDSVHATSGIAKEPYIGELDAGQSPRELLAGQYTDELPVNEAETRR